MIDIKHEVTKGGSMELKKAILLYGEGANSVATIHDVELRNNDPIVLPGRGISLHNLQDLVVALTTDKKSYYLDERILACCFTRMVWHCPSARRHIYFSTANRKFNRSFRAEVTHPGLIFMAEPMGLSVFAIDDPPKGKRPLRKSRLYVAPYFNVWAGGKVCAGSAKFSKIMIPSAIPSIEREFFGASFTHNSRGGKEVCNYPGGHNAFWLAMRGKRKKKVKMDWLIPMNITLEDAIDAPPTA